MLAITEEQLSDRIAGFVSHTQSKLRLNDRSLAFADPVTCSISFPWPESPLRVSCLVRQALLADVGEEALFDGGFLWFSLVDIGSPQLEKSGWRMVERMRASYGELRDLRSSPVHLFRTDELVDACAFLVPAFVYQWDAWFVSLATETFVHISHDEFWWVVTRDKSVREQLLSNSEHTGARLDERLVSRFRD